MKLLSSPWILAVLALVTYLATTAAMLRKENFEVARAAPVEQHPTKAVLLWDASSPEVDQMISNLRQEKDALDERQKTVAELEGKLALQRVELTQATQLVQRLQQELEESLTRVREDEIKNVKKLAKVYTGMSPDGAAGILKNMQDVEIVRIMMAMKEPESAPILEAFGKLGAAEAKRAAAISDKLRLAVQRKDSAAKSSQP